MTGTRWTEPGQGATVEQFMDTLGDTYRYSGTGFHPAMANMYSILRLDSNGAPTNFDMPNRRTNLALTGEPLTADDVRRIGEAK